MLCSAQEKKKKKLNQCSILSNCGLISGQAHGNHVEKSFVFEKPIELIAGTNHILLLAQAVGYPVCTLYTWFLLYKAFDKLLIIVLDF